MSLSLSRLCCRLCLSICKNSVIRSRSSYPPVVVISRSFCSANPNSEIEIENQVSSPDEFEDFTGHNELLENVDYDTIVGDDLEAKKKLQVLVLELSMRMQTEALAAPKRLTAVQWRKLLSLKNELAKLRYLETLYSREKRKEIVDVVKRERTEKRMKILEEDRMNGDEITTSSPVKYALRSNTLFYRIYSSEITKRKYFNLAMALMFGPDLIIDCSYEEYMTSAENFGCARQIMFLWCMNRDSKNPFNLILCNVNPNGKLMTALTKLFCSSKFEDMFLNLTEKHYLELFPAKQLVYLSPHTSVEMEKYDSNSVYIIGAYVDEIVNKPVSLAKAKRDEIRHVKFPLDKYLNWAQGSKLLPLNQVLGIMSDLKDGGCWQYAFRHVAVRKQVFQFFDNDQCFNHRNEKLAAAHLRENVRRDMLRQLNIRKLFVSKKVDDDPASNPT